MKALRRFFQRLTSWTTSARDEDVLRAEIDDHIARQTADNLRAGMTAIEARRQALLKFGNVDAIKESYRDQRGLPFMETLLRDTRHALRRLRRTPAFTAAVLLTLALGIGANTAIFGVVDSVLIRPLPYPHAEALVGIWHTAPGQAFGGITNCSPSMYFTYREQNRTFQQFGLWGSTGASVTGAAEPEVLRALLVTYGVLDALDEKPLLGRWFSPADDTPGSPETVILTYGYWQRRFNGDRSILGRTMTINSTAHTVIGVMPEEFRFQRDPVLILPARFERSKVNLGTFAYQGIARLKPGVTIAQANADLARMLEIWLHAWPPPPGFERAGFQDARFGPRIQPLKQEIVGDAGTALWVVMGTLGLVLLIVCANVANLFLVRTETRRQELAIRAALGAGWGRIAREMLVECMTLGVLGGALGLGLAYAALRILVAKGPATLPRLNEIRIDPLVLAFCLGVSVLSGALFGLIPVLKYAGARGGATLGGVGRTIGQSREHNRARNTLVVVQVALALVLLVGSGLMIRTFQQLRRVQPGFTHGSTRATSTASEPPLSPTKWRRSLGPGPGSTSSCCGPTPPCSPPAVPILSIRRRRCRRLLAALAVDPPPGQARGGHAGAPCPPARDVLVGQAALVDARLAHAQSLQAATIRTVWCPVAPSGRGEAGCAVWMYPVPSVARTATRCSPAPGPPSPAVHQACDDNGSVKKPGTHSPPSAATSTAATPSCGAHATPAHHHRAGGNPAPGQVDPRLGLDRRRLGPPPRDPIGVEAIPRGQLDLGQPLRRRHVSVQAGNDEPGGKAVFRRERIAVHGQGDHRLASVKDHLGGKAHGEPVHRAAHHLGGAGLSPARSRTSASRTPVHRALPTREPPT